MVLSLGAILLSDTLRIYLCVAAVMIIMPDVDACYESHVRQSKTYVKHTCILLLNVFILIDMYDTSL
jgi:hypothetical protein